MNFEIAIPPSMKEALREHLLGDRSKEQMAVVLCGLARSKSRIRLLGRHVITMPPEAFSHQSSVGLELDQSVQRRVLERAAREGLSQVDFHTHPGEGEVHFSGIDDQNETALAKYIASHIPQTLYASVVLNGKSIAARLWDASSGNPKAVPICPPDIGNSGLSANGTAAIGGPLWIPGRYDRQVRAFGAEFQRRLSRLRIGLVGVGGLGSVIVEQLTRLGVSNWILVDPDIVEETNLNRLLGAEERDVKEERSKVEVARRTIRRVMPKANVVVFRTSVFADRTLKALTTCDLLIAATDNDASRLVLNALAAQFLIELVHVGVNLEPGKEGFSDISGEVVIPSPGEWCLLCAGAIDPQRASRDLASDEEREIMAERGYIKNTPAPAVYHLNALSASLAVAEIHNLIWPYKPLRRYLAYRELEGEIMAIKVPKAEDCPHCDLRGLGDLLPIWRPGPRKALPSLALSAAQAENAK